MLTPDDVGTCVTDHITTLLVELDEEDVPEVEATSSFADLGLDSLSLARLIIELEDELGVEPFRSEEASVADLRSVGDLVRAYQDAVGRRTPVQA
jgi:acyl carrier protein